MAVLPVLQFWRQDNALLVQCPGCEQRLSAGQLVLPAHVRPCFLPLRLPSPPASAPSLGKAGHPLQASMQLPAPLTMSQITHHSQDQQVLSVSVGAGPSTDTHHTRTYTQDRPRRPSDPTLAFGSNRTPWRPSKGSCRARAPAGPGLLATLSLLQPWTCPQTWRALHCACSPPCPQLHVGRKTLCWPCCSSKLRPFLQTWGSRAKQSPARLAQTGVSGTGARMLGSAGRTRLPRCTAFQVHVQKLQAGPHGQACLHRLSKAWMACVSLHDASR